MAADFHLPMLVRCIFEMNLSSIFITEGIFSTKDIAELLTFDQSDASPQYCSVLLANET